MQVLRWSIYEDTRRIKVKNALRYFFLLSVTNRCLGPKTPACLLVVSAHDYQVSKLVCKREQWRRSRRNVYLLKIGAKSFGDGSQDICKDTESNLGRLAGLLASNYPEASCKVYFSFRAERHAVNHFFLSLCFLFCFLFCSLSPREFFLAKSRFT